MAAPAYSTDLITINTADGTDGNNANGGWSETSGHAVGAAPIFDGDVVIQGLTAVSKQTGQNATGVEAGFCVETGVNILADASWVTNQSVVMFWWNMLYPAALESYTFTGIPDGESVTVTGGFFLGMGASEANQRYWNVGGNDKFSGPLGGWISSVIDPTQASQYTDGNPSNTVIDVFSCLPNLAQSIRRGQTMAMDVVRWAPRGKITIAGGTAPDSPATFARIAEFNDRDVTTADSEFTLIDSGRHRLGFFTDLGGTFSWKGQLELTGNLTDENAIILVEEVVHTPDNFTELLVNGGNLDLSSSNIVNVGQDLATKAGRINMTSGSLTLAGCALQSVGPTFISAGQYTISNTAFNGCSTVLLSGSSFGTITGCQFEEAREFAINVSGTNTRINNITGCTFNSTDTHGVFTTSTADFTWDNFLGPNVPAGTTGSPVTTTNLGNEAVYISNSTGTVTINVADGADVPSVRSNGAVVNVIAGQRTLTIDVSDITTGLAVQDARVLVTAAAGGNLAVGTVIIDKVLTDANGEASDTRTYTANQPFIGTVRRATTGTLYKPASISGTISSGADTTINVSLIPDE